MSESGLLTTKATAVEYGIHPRTVTDIARLLRLQPKGMSNGKAKGYDPDDRKMIGRALKTVEGLAPPRRRAAQAAGA